MTDFVYPTEEEEENEVMAYAYDVQRKKTGNISEHQRTSRLVKQKHTTDLNGFNDSSDDFESESPMSLRRSQRSKRRRVDKLALRDHHVAGRMLPKRPLRHSTDPDPAIPHLQVGRDGETQHDGSNEHPRTAPTCVAHVTIHSLSRHASVLLAYYRGHQVPMWYDDELASAMDDALGHAVKLTSISIESLPARAWLLSGLVLGPAFDGDVRICEGQLTVQPAQTAESAERVSQDALHPRRRPQSSGVRFGAEDQRSVSSDDASNTSDASSNGQEYSQERVEHGDSDEEADGLGCSSDWKSSHLKGSEWATSEDEHLRLWIKRDARPKWKAIFRRFPKRTDPSVGLRGQLIRKEIGEARVRG